MKTRIAATPALKSALIVAVMVSQIRAESIPPDLRRQAGQSVDRALVFLKNKQAADGGWTTDYGPAVTAIVSQAFVQSPDYGPNHSIVRRATEAIVRHAQDDGGIYEKRQNLANYQTSVVLMYLSSLPPGDHKERIARAQAFLTNLQYDEAERIKTNDVWYGGAGYNSRKRPDLSNTQMMLEALHQSGLPATDPVYQRALVFVSRCQMLETTNDQKFARKARDGGFIYSPSNGGESKADEGLFESLGPPRSYGSMTYAGFKSLLYAGLGRDDERVKACWEWIRTHYTLNENPNLPGRRNQEGLYYYYHVFARALDAYGEETITDPAGGVHAWRIDLCRKLISLQRPDGSWLNEKDRWLEGDANYITGLTAQSMQIALATRKLGA